MDTCQDDYTMENTSAGRLAKVVGNSVVLIKRYGKYRNAFRCVWPTVVVKDPWNVASAWCDHGKINFQGEYV